MDIGQTVTCQFLNHIIEQWLRIGIRSIVGGRDRGQANADLSSTNSFRHSIDNFKQETSAIFDRAAIFITTLIAARTQELIDQVTICSMDFHAVKSGNFNRILRSSGIIRYDPWKLTLFQCTRFGSWCKFARPIRVNEISLGVGRDRRRSHRLCSVRLQAGV